MKTMGTVMSWRRFSTNAKILSVVIPPFNALTLAPSITGPSAVGSENGIPNSIRSAPPETAARMAVSVISRSGSPQVINAINALLLSNACLILLIDILPSIACNSSAVLVSTSGDGDNDNLFFVHRWSQLHGIGHSMG